MTEVRLPFALAFSCGGVADARTRGRRLALQAASRVRGRAHPQATIGHEATGRPRWLGACGEGIDVSISHSGPGAAAAAVRGRRIGIDMERLGDIPPPSSWRYFLTEREARDCASRPHRALWSWVLKEAAYKALGHPGPLRWRQFEVVGWDRPAPCLTIHGDAGFAPEIFLERRSGFALAVVLL